MKLDLKFMETSNIVQVYTQPDKVSYSHEEDSEEISLGRKADARVFIAISNGLPFTLHKQACHISRTGSLKGLHYYKRMAVVDKWTHISMETYEAFDCHLANLHKSCSNILQAEMALTYRLRSIQFLYRPEEVKMALRKLKDIFSEIKSCGLELPNYPFLYVAVSEMFSRFYLIKGKMGKSWEWSEKGLLNAHYLEPCERTGLMLRANGQLFLHIARVNPKPQKGLALTKLKSKAGTCFDLMVQHFQQEIEEGGEFEFYVLEGYLLLLYTKLDCFLYQGSRLLPSDTCLQGIFQPMSDHDKQRVRCMINHLRTKLQHLVQPYKDMVYLLDCFNLILRFKTKKLTSQDLEPFCESRRHFEETGHLKIKEVDSDSGQRCYEYNNPSFNFLLHFSNVITEPLTDQISRTLDIQKEQQSSYDSDMSGESDIM